jgi:hypothetical protein
VLALLTSSGKFLIVTNEKEHREDKNRNTEIRLILGKRISRLGRFTPRGGGGGTSILIEWEVRSATEAACMF